MSMDGFRLGPVAWGHVDRRGSDLFSGISLLNVYGFAEECPIFYGLSNFNLSNTRSWFQYHLQRL